MDNKSMGAFIARCRKELNLSQKQLAEKLTVTDKAVSKWETGNGAPDIALLVPLADILNVTVVELLDGKRTENNDNKEQTQKVVIETLQEVKKERVRVMISLLLAVAILFLTINVVAYAYWGRRHKVLYNVDSVYIHQRDDNPNIYDLYYNVTVKNWWFDFIQHKYKLTDALQGGYGEWHFEAETEYFTTKLYKTSFIIHAEFDVSTADFYPVPDDPIKELVMMSRFNALTSSGKWDDRASLYMEDFPNVEIIVL